MNNLKYINISKLKVSGKSVLKVERKRPLFEHFFFFAAGTLLGLFDNANCYFMVEQTNVIFLFSR